ncbi:hypothetical protein ACKKBG_A24075 [Auxenochlorella protothecoides x Auxenochlorella symbiontica]
MSSSEPNNSGALDPSSLAPRILQVVQGDGTFDEPAVQAYMHSSGVESTGIDYTVVAIMGPQSSGKSTLLNALFGTSFTEMDALSGRSQTTRGVWLAPAPRISEPLTLVMDLEGSDGRERGEDDTSFERQSALFALAVADVVVVNMWAKDVGRESGAGKPLLKTIFQVNLKLFQPAAGQRRTVLLFVFRDRTRTPLDLLRSTWEVDLVRMWEGIAKPPAYEGLPLTDFFEVQYAALANYEDRAEDFRAETHLLRRRFTQEDPETLLRSYPTKLPGAALGLSMAKVWEVIRANKDLNLPAHRVMVANLRCAELAEATFQAFAEDPAWQEVAGEADLVPGFGWRVSDQLTEALAGYDEEARYFDPDVSAAKRAGLTSDLLDLVRPAFVAQLDALRGMALAGFSAQLADPQAPEGEAWVDRVARLEAEALAMFDSTAPDLAVGPAAEAWAGLEAGAREGLRSALGAEAAATRGEVVRAALAAAERSAAAAVGAAAGPLFDSAPADLWRRGARAVDAARDAAAARLENALDGYGVGASEGLALIGGVETAARARLLAAAREAANTALSRLRERFHDRFSRDEAGLPRAWTAKSDVAGAAAAGRAAAAALLALLAVARLPRAGALSPRAAAQAEAAEAVTRAVEALAVEGQRTAPGSSATAPGAPPSELDALTAAEWPGVDPEDVLLDPPAVRAIWRQFSSDSAIAVQQAAATREANRLAGARGPPLWAIAAMAVLGFNEAMAVLRNPLWLLLLLLAFLFARTVYNELDVEGEMANGLLPGALAVAAKFWPTLQRVVHQTLASAKKFLAEDEGGAPRAGDAADGSGPGGFARAEPASSAAQVVRRQDSGIRPSVRSPVGLAPLPAYTREVEMTEAIEEEPEHEALAAVEEEDAPHAGAGVSAAEEVEDGGGERGSAAPLEVTLESSTPPAVDPRDRDAASGQPQAAPDESRKDR